MSDPTVLSEYLVLSCGQWDENASQQDIQGAIDAFYPFDPDGGHGYVWHCHIIDHEDNEMMRPTQVQANPAATRTLIQGTHY